MIIRIRPTGWLRRVIQFSLAEQWPLWAMGCAGAGAICAAIAAFGGVR